MLAAKLFGIQIVLPNEPDAEMKILAAKMTLENSSLVFYDSEGLILTAFSPNSWRAVWQCTPDGTPLCWNQPLDELPPEIPASPHAGLLSDSPLAAPVEKVLPRSSLPVPENIFSSDETNWPAPAPIAPITSAPPVSDPLSVPEREGVLASILNALDIHPYLSLEQFSLDSEIAPELIEKGIISALASKAILPGRVADADIQRNLDLFLPEIIRAHKPKKALEMLDHLRNQEETKDADLIQLKVWMLRNPKKHA